MSGKRWSIIASESVRRTRCEFALGEVLRKIIAQEQERLQDLAAALGIDTPKIE